jgi:adenylate cyclase
MPPELVYETEGRRVTFALTKDEVTIGRATDNDVVIKDGLISRHHARLHRVDDGWRVTDLGSSNGTRVNDRDPGKRVLKNGDRIQVHKLDIVFRDGELPGMSLILDPAQLSTDPLGSGTIVRSAVDFSALASDQKTMGVPAGGENKLEQLLKIVTKASQALLASTSLDETLDTVLTLVFEHLNVDRGCIMLWDDEKQDLVVRCLKQTGKKAGEIRFSRTIAEKVYKEKVSILTNDAMHDDRFAGGQSIIDLNIRAAMAAPLWNGEKVEGLIYVDSPIRTKAFDNFDLDVLSALGNHAAVAIEQSRLQNSIMEEQLMRQKLARYHSPSVIEHITAQSDSVERLNANEMEVTVLFADVVGFTRRCERMEPTEVAELLNRYFSEMAECIFRHDGTLDKFIGDCLMAVFGAPMAVEDHALRGVQAALDMREALAALNEPLPPKSRMQFRIGMHSGNVVAGDIGSLRRSDYTVLGSTVNLAARLESAVAEPGQIVISDLTCHAIQEHFETRLLGEHQPKGISRKVSCFEVLGPK